MEFGRGYLGRRVLTSKWGPKAPFPKNNFGQPRGGQLAKNHWGALGNP